jgi:hypothetical protein
MEEFAKIHQTTYFDVRLTQDPHSYLPLNSGGIPEMEEFADALQDAIEKGIVTKPGMYKIQIIRNPILWEIMGIYNYNIYKFDESGADDPALD